RSSRAARRLVPDVYCELMFYVLTTAYVLICFLLLVVVLMQRGKGGGMAAFGGGGSETAFGARAGATVLTRATTVLATLFMVISLVLGIMWRSGGGSVVSGVSGPAPAPASAPAPAAETPQTPAPETPQEPQADQQ